MKWYKKQLDQLKKVEKEKEAAEEKKSGVKKGPRHSFEQRKVSHSKSPRSPVAESKLQRPKTDAR